MNQLNRRMAHLIPQQHCAHSPESHMRTYALPPDSVCIRITVGWEEKVFAICRLYFQCFLVNIRNTSLSRCRSSGHFQIGLFNSQIKSIQLQFNFCKLLKKIEIRKEEASFGTISSYHSILAIVFHLYYPASKGFIWLSCNLSEPLNEDQESQELIFMLKLFKPFQLQHLLTYNLA